MELLNTYLTKTPLVPLVGAEDPKTAVEISKALVDGGLKVLEVVLRTDAAMDCLQAICEEVPEALTGVGTVLTGAQAKQSVERGAQFIVSPGLVQGVVRAAQEEDRVLLAGIATATELQQAYNYGLRTVKFFPAELAGGAKMLKAFSSVFRDVKFMPTGGVNLGNLADYLAIDSVLACGGSWLTPKNEIAKGNYAAITKLANEAIDLAAKIRPAS